MIISQFVKRSKSETPSDEVSNLKEENDQLRCQLHAYENENDLLKTENKSVKESSEKERKMMQNMIKGAKGILAFGCPNLWNGIVLGGDTRFMSEFVRWCSAGFIGLEKFASELCLSWEAFPCVCPKILRV